MKNKYLLYINCLLLCLLFLIGFSPQNNRYFTNTVYAETTIAPRVTDSALDNLDTSGLSSTLDNLELIKDNTTGMKDNILDSVELISTVLSSISTGMSGFALALSVVVIARIGFKIMNSGQGDIFQFIKQKKDVSNAIVCILFILIIPTVVKSILNFKPPAFLMNEVNSSFSEGDSITNILATPSSGLVEYLKENAPSDSSGSSGTSSASNETSEEGVFGSISDEPDGLSGLFKKIYEIVLKLFANITYAPLLLITSLLGSIGFYPMSLDPLMYDDTIQNIINEYLKVSSGGVIAFGVDGVISSVGKGLLQLTNVLNVLYFICKNFCMLCLEVVCYYFGIMHLMNQETDSVQGFLTRLSQGVIGMFIFPYFLEFLLDIDGVISMSISRLTGAVVPGFSILTMLPSVNESAKGFTILVLSCFLAVMVLMLAKSFFIRRIEISLFYVVSPVVFLKHMMKSSDSSVKKMLDKILSAVFLTTLYSPLFVILLTMINLGQDGDTNLVYFIMILGILWCGKDVINSIIGMFSGSSTAAGSAVSQLNKGIDLSKNATRFTGGLAAYGAVKGAMKGGQYIKDSGGVKGALKNAGNKALDTYSRAANYADKNGFLKSTGKALGELGKGGLSAAKSGSSYAKNIAENKFWEKYEGASKKYDKYTPSGASLKAVEGKGNRIERTHEQNNARQRAEFKAAVLDKYRDNPGKAKKLMKDYDEMMANNPKAQDFFSDNESFLQKMEKYKDSKIISKDSKKAIANSEKLFAKTAQLEEMKQNLISQGKFEEAIDIESKINKNKALFTSNMGKIQRVVDEEVRQNARLESLDSLNSATKSTGRFISNDMLSGVRAKDSSDVNKALNTLLMSTDNATAKEKINTVINNGFTNKNGSVNVSTISSLVADLKATGMSDEVLTNFTKNSFDIDSKQATSHVKLMGELAASDSKMQITKAQSNYSAKNSDLEQSFSIIRNSNNGNPQLKTKIDTFISAGKENNIAPKASEVSSFVTGLVNDNLITREEATSVLGVTFGCNKEDAVRMLNFNDAKTTYETKSFSKDEFTSKVQNIDLSSLSKNQFNDVEKIYAEKTISKAELTAKAQKIKLNGSAEKQFNEFVSNSNGNIKPADIITYTNKMQEDNLISKKQAQYIVSNTLDIQPEQAERIVSYDKHVQFNESVKAELGSYVNTANGSINSSDVVAYTNKMQENKLINKKQAEYIVSSTLGVQPEQAQCIIDYDKDFRFNNDLASLEEKGYNSVDYLEFTSKHEPLLANAQEVAVEKFSPIVNVSAVHGATSFRGADIAVSQLEKLETIAINKNDEEAKERINTVKTQILTADNNREAESKLTNFIVNESSIPSSIDDVVLNDMAVTTLGFSSNQASEHMKFVQTHVVDNKQIDVGYKQAVASYDVNSETNALEYIQLTNGANSSNYHSVAETFIDKVTSDGVKGPLEMNLDSLSNSAKANNIEINVKDIEHVLHQNSSNVKETITNKAKLVRSGSQKSRELISNIETPGDGNNAFVDENIVYNKNNTERDGYDNGDSEINLKNGSVNPNKFKRYYKYKPTP